MTLRAFAIAALLSRSQWHLGCPYLVTHNPLYVQASKRKRSGSADQGSESESDVSDQSVVEEEDLEPEVLAHPAPGEALWVLCV